MTNLEKVEKINAGLKRMAFTAKDKSDRPAFLQIEGPLTLFVAVEASLIGLTVLVPGDDGHLILPLALGSNDDSGGTFLAREAQRLQRLHYTYAPVAYRKGRGLVVLSTNMADGVKVQWFVVENTEDGPQVLGVFPDDPSAWTAYSS